MHFELSPLIVLIALWIVNTYSNFQENTYRCIFSNKRDIKKCQTTKTKKKLHNNDNKNDAKAIAIPRVSL